MIKKRIEGLFCQESSTFSLKCSVWERCMSGQIGFLGMRYVISDAKGRVSRFVGATKPF
ncbi:hypothetical protein [Phocaeicola faecalis]|uniref:hypothetical protein n=1 Tax=Phocaeicola faecalis TaxID=2786956 RepID=UPI001F2634AD|nr:hypothetical protein [Phocaeicola faecalis]